MFIIYIVLILIIIILAIKSIKFVGQSEALVIERLGRYYQTVFSGMVILIPFVDRVRAKHKLGDTMTVISKEGTTSDGKHIVIEGNLIYKVIDPVTATYNVQRDISNIRYIFEYSALIVCQRMKFNELEAMKDKIKEKILVETKTNSENWGIEISDMNVNFFPMA